MDCACWASRRSLVWKQRRKSSRAVRTAPRQYSPQSEPGLRSAHAEDWLTQSRGDRSGESTDFKIGQMRGEAEPRPGPKANDDQALLSQSTLTNLGAICSCTKMDQLVLWKLRPAWKVAFCFVDSLNAIGPIRPMSIRQRIQRPATYPHELRYRLPHTDHTLLHIEIRWVIRWFSTFPGATQSSASSAASRNSGHRRTRCQAGGGLPWFDQAGLYEHLDEMPIVGQSLIPESDLRLWSAMGRIARTHLLNCYFS